MQVSNLCFSVLFLPPKAVIGQNFNDASPNGIMGVVVAETNPLTAPNISFI